MLSIQKLIFFQVTQDAFLRYHLPIEQSPLRRSFFPPTTNSIRAYQTGYNASDNSPCRDRNNFVLDYSHS